jgi:hypothetical protein
MEDDASDDGKGDDEGVPTRGGAAAPAAAAEYETYADAPDVGADDDGDADAVDANDDRCWWAAAVPGTDR